MNNHILSFAKKLISIPSTKENHDALREVLKVALKELDGFTVEKFEKNNVPSLLAYKEAKRPEKFKVILNAHLDVVPGKENQYHPTEKGGKLYGRGAYDMKTAAAVEILLFKELAKKLPYSLGLQLVADEEIGGHNGTKFQVEKGVKADFVIAGENTDLAIRNESKGVMWAKLKTKGKVAHGAYPWLGSNALWNLYEDLEKIKKAYPVPQKGGWQTTVNLSRIETTNAAFNQVPDNATALLDIRYIAKEQKIILSNIKKPLSKNSSLEVILVDPPAYTDNTNTYVTSLANSVKNIARTKTLFSKASGASDVRFYTSSGSHGVEFGLIGANHHADDEWVDIKSLEDYYNILREFLLSLAS